MTWRDLETVGRIHRISFPRSVSSTIPDRYFGWYLSHRDAIALVVSTNDRVVGYVAGAPEGYASILYRDLWSAIGSTLLRHPRLALRRQFIRQLPTRLGNWLGRPERRGIDRSEPRRPMVSVVLGVDPNHRRTGIGLELKQAFVAAAWAKGFELVCCSVFASNQAARSLNARAGWKLALSGRTLRFVVDRSDRIVHE